MVSLAEKLGVFLPPEEEFASRQDARKKRLDDRVGPEAQVNQTLEKSGVERAIEMARAERVEARQKALTGRTDRITS